MNITFMEMPPSAQKHYNTTNTVRKISLFIGWILYPLTFIASLSQGFEGETVLTVTLGNLIIAASIHGFVHMEFLFKNLLRKFRFIGLCLFFMIATFLIAADWIFLIVDTVLFIKKKPLVYPFEHKYFIYSKKALVEIEMAERAELLDALNSSTSKNVANELKSLKSMLDQGLITEEEYNKKKSELLDTI